MDPRRTLLKYKGDRCVNCGRTVQEIVEEWGSYKRKLHLHHVDPATKHPKYDQLMKRKRLSEEMIDEADKCQLLCAFCHMGVEDQNLMGTITVETKIGRRKRKQTMPGQAVVNLKKKTIKLLGGEPLKLTAFLVTYNGKRKGYFTRQDFEQDARILKLISATRTEGKLVILLDGRPVFTARKHDENTVLITSEARFDVFKVALATCNNQMIWARNGKAISSKGEVGSQFRYSGTMLYSELEKAT